MAYYQCGRSVEFGGTGWPEEITKGDDGAVLPIGLEASRAVGLRLDSRTRAPGSFDATRELGGLARGERLQI